MPDGRQDTLKFRPAIIYRQSLVRKDRRVESSRDQVSPKVTRSDPVEQIGISFHSLSTTKQMFMHVANPRASNSLPDPVVEGFSINVTQGLTPRCITVAYKSMRTSLRIG